MPVRPSVPATRTAYEIAIGLSLLASILQWLVLPWVSEGVPFLFILPALSLRHRWVVGLQSLHGLRSVKCNALAPACRKLRGQ
jgi:hypothetical protein